MRVSSQSGTGAVSVDIQHLSWYEKTPGIKRFNIVDVLHVDEYNYISMRQKIYGCNRNKSVSEFKPRDAISRYTPVFFHAMLETYCLFARRMQGA